MKESQNNYSRWLANRFTFVIWRRKSVRNEVQSSWEIKKGMSSLRHECVCHKLKSYWRQETYFESWHQDSLLGFQWYGNAKEHPLPQALFIALISI